MKVEELMTRNVKTCHRDTNLAEVASILWESDCGALPVVDDDHKVVGIISDRDICLAVATKGRLASEVAVGEITSGRPVFTCTSNDSIQDALATMQMQQVRRIPVVNQENRIEGILSISDVVLAAQKEAWGNQQGVSNNEAISTLKAICERRHTSSNVTASASSAAQA
jgi:CBS domain-containing protein